MTLTRHGVPVAVLVRPDALRPRRAAAAYAKAEEIDRMLREARQRPLPEKGRLSLNGPNRWSPRFAATATLGEARWTPMTLTSWCTRPRTTRSGRGCEHC